MESNITSHRNTSGRNIVKTLPVGFASFIQLKIFLNFWIKIYKEYGLLETKQNILDQQWARYSPPSQC